MTRPRTPLWVRATLVATVVCVTGWLTATHLDRVGNETRLSAIATQIAGRPVRVHCPGVLARHLSWDIVEGSVQFDAQGRPSDTANLQAKPCAELDALAEGRRADVLRCIACATPEAVDLAMAVDVLTHESFHLAGIADEAQTECHALAEMARTAQRLGTTPEQGAALADLERRTNYLSLPERYRTDCRDLVDQPKRSMTRAAYQSSQRSVGAASA